MGHSNRAGEPLAQGKCPCSNKRHSPSFQTTQASVGNYVPRGRLLAGGQAGEVEVIAHQVVTIPHILRHGSGGLGPAEGAGGGVIGGRIQQKTQTVQVLLHGVLLEGCQLVLTQDPWLESWIKSRCVELKSTQH